MRTVVGIGAAVVVAFAPVALAAPNTLPCPRGNNEYVLLSFEATNAEGGCAVNNPEIEERVLDLVRVDLASQHVEICNGSASTYLPPLAKIHVRNGCAEDYVVSIVLTDYVTQKELTRNVTLAGMPRDSHALTIAIGAVELLRASWAETQLTRGSGAQRDLPIPVEGVLEKEPRHNQLSTYLGVGIVGEKFGGNLLQVGLDAEVSRRMSRYIDIVGQVGGRTARSVSSTHGEVIANGWLVGVGVNGLIYEPSSKVSFRLSARLNTMRIAFSAQPTKPASASATSRAGYGAWATLGLVSSIHFAERAWFDSEIFGGDTFRPVTATDAGNTVMGLRGICGGFRLSTRIAF